MLYRFLQVVVYVVAKLVFRLRVTGRAHVPDFGGVIVAANHASYLDIPILGCVLKRRAVFLAKSELFRNPILGRIFRFLGGIPIRRGDFDRKALTEVVDRLRRGQLVVFYPEGTRSPDGRLQRFKPGIGLAAVRAGVPIVPVYIDGTGGILPKQSRSIRIRPISIHFARPIRPLELVNGHGDAKKGTYLRISQAVMAQITAMKEGQPDAVHREMQFSGF